MHIVKGFNIPVRNESIPFSFREQIKSNAIGQAYKNGQSNYQSGIMNQILKRSWQQGNSVYGQQNPQQNPMMNNSGAFNPQLSGGHNSFLGGINPNFQDFNNAYTGQPQNPSPFNPLMMNPVQHGMNNQIQIPQQLQAFDGDIVQMVDLLRNFVGKNVESFVEVKMQYYDQEIEFRTDSVDGIHPDYNSKMNFTLKPKNGQEFFSREELKECSGNFYFCLYDELRTEDKIFEKDSNTYIYKYEKKYLGSFKIPFTTLFQNGNLLETVSKVNVPQTVFGYYHDTSSIFDVLNNTEQDLRNKEGPKQESAFGNTSNRSGFKLVDDVKRIINPNVNSYISLYMTLDPVPGINKIDDSDYTPGFEDSIFLINATKWLKSVKDSNKKDRNIRILAENFDGYSVYMPRYIRKGGQKPPEIILDEVNNPNDEFSIEKAARFVSLIPFVEDGHSFDYDEMPDCWCTDEQFLTLNFGDYEEHAILLCNYFNYIDKVQKRENPCVSYLALCNAYPEGLSTYVMRQSVNTPDVEFWNAKTGDCYYYDKRYEENKFLCFSVTKSFKTKSPFSATICQIKDIGTLISNENIYVNLQQIGDPGVLDFDLSNESNWKPFLNEASKKKIFPRRGCEYSTRSGVRISNNRRRICYEGNYSRVFEIDNRKIESLVGTRRKAPKDFMGKNSQRQNRRTAFRI